MNIKFNPTCENNGCISFLDLLIRKPYNLEIDIFRKPTTADTTISFFSNDPMEHKIATYRHHITRMHLLPLTTERKQTEWTLIPSIGQNINFLGKLLQDLKLQIQHKKPTRIKTIKKTTKTKNGQPSRTIAQK
jgi:hypothetical protein